MSFFDDASLFDFMFDLDVDASASTSEPDPPNDLSQSIERILESLDDPAINTALPFDDYRTVGGLQDEEDNAVLENAVAGPSGQKRGREEDAEEEEENAPPRKAARTSRATPRQPLCCLWKHEDGHICEQSGTADEVWQHICQDHDLAWLVKRRPAQPALMCGWRGCTATGVPSELSLHWEKEHKGELKEEKVRRRKEPGYLMKCPLCPEREGLNARGQPHGHFAPSSMPRHVTGTHWGDRRKRWCDVCGQLFSADTYDQPARDHRTRCVRNFMAKTAEFRR